MSVFLVILSDVRLYREGLALSVESQRRGIEVVGVCGDAGEVLERVRWHPRAVVLVDVAMAGWLEKVRRVAAGAPGVALLALALAPDTEREIVETAEAGIAGYVPPDASVEDLVSAVEHAARGEMLCSPRVAGALARRVASLASWGAPPPAGSLTEREREVLELMEGGLSNKQISHRLSIRLATVKNHVHSILGKLNVARRGEAVAALREGRAGHDRPAGPRPRGAWVRNGRDGSLTPPAAPEPPAGSPG